MKQNIMTITFIIGLLSVVRIVHAEPLNISTFEGKDNPVIMIAKNVMAEAYIRIGRTMKLNHLPGKRSLVVANRGDVDGELFRMEGLEQSFPNLRRIPVAIVTVEFVVFTKGNIFPIEDWKSLLPYHVGYMRGIKTIEANLAEGTHSTAVNTLEQVFKILEHDRSDVVIHARLSGLMTLNKLGIKDTNILKPSLLINKQYHYLHIKNQHLIEPLTEVLLQMEKEGIIQQIQQQVEQAIISP